MKGFVLCIILCVFARFCQVNAQTTTPSNTPSDTPVPTPLSNQVYINEISSNSQDDWVELYNSSDVEVDISTYILKDSVGILNVSFEGVKIPPKNVFTVEVSNRLNIDEDVVSLYRSSNDGVAVDQVSYGKTGIISAPGVGQSIGSKIDGGEEIVFFEPPTKNKSNAGANVISPSPTSIPPSHTTMPSRTPTPSPTQIPPSNPSPTLFVPTATAKIISITPTKSLKLTPTLTDTDQVQFITQSPTASDSILGIGVESASHSATNNNKYFPIIVALLCIGTGTGLLSLVFILRKIKKGQTSGTLEV